MFRAYTFNEEEKVNYFRVLKDPSLVLRISKEAWIRILPPLEKSRQKKWYWEVLTYKGRTGHIASPILERKPLADTLFETAKKKFPDLLYNKNNPKGIKLLPNRYGIAWVVHYNNSVPELKILFASSYNGSRGGNPGLIAKINNEAQRRNNEPGSSNFGELLYGEITSLKEGRKILIEKSGAMGAYSIAFGTQGELNFDEVKGKEKIEPIENLIRIPTVEEEREFWMEELGETYNLLSENQKDGDPYTKAFNEMVSEDYNTPYDVSFVLNEIAQGRAKNLRLELVPEEFRKVVEACKNS